MHGLLRASSANRRPRCPLTPGNIFEAAEHLCRSIRFAPCHNPFWLGDPSSKAGKARPRAGIEAMSVLRAGVRAVLLTAFIGSAAAASSQTFAIYGGELLGEPFTS